MEQTNQQPKKRSREEMGGGRGSSNSNGGGRGGQSRKKSKNNNNNNETPHWVLDYKKSQKSNQNQNVEARQTRSAAAGGSHNDNSGQGGKKAAANHNNNTKAKVGGKGRGSGGGRQIDMQRNGNHGRGGRNSNSGRGGKGGRGLWHGGWKPVSRTVSRSSSSDTSVANPLSIQRKNNKNTKVTTLSWVDPATHYIAIKDEGKLLDVCMFCIDLLFLFKSYMLIYALSCCSHLMLIHT